MAMVDARPQSSTRFAHQGGSIAATNTGVVQQQVHGSQGREAQRQCLQHIHSHEEVGSYGVIPTTEPANATRQGRSSHSQDSACAQGVLQALQTAISGGTEGLAQAGVTPQRRSSKRQFQLSHDEVPGDFSDESVAESPPGADHQV